MCSIVTDMRQRIKQIKFFILFNPLLHELFFLSVFERQLKLGSNRLRLIGNFFDYPFLFKIKILLQKVNLLPYHFSVFEKSLLLF